MLIINTASLFEGFKEWHHSQKGGGSITEDDAEAGDFLRDGM